jgi:hypothetical protein
MILFDEKPYVIFENEDRKRIIATSGRIFFISLPPI